MQPREMLEKMYKVELTGGGHEIRVVDENEAAIFRGGKRIASSRVKEGAGGDDLIFREYSIDSGITGGN